MKANSTVTAVPGVLGGHWTHSSRTTGTTVLLFPDGAVGGVWIPGSAPGSREIGALAPDHIAARVDGLVLSGGSAYGLATADGVMDVLRQREQGFDTGAGVVPIVPAAVLFDLPVAEMQPTAESGRLAALAASGDPLPTGPIGAGAGARVGKVGGQPAQGGIGSISLPVGEFHVGAVAAVNAFGAVVDPDTGALIAGSLPNDGTPNLGAGWREQTTLVAVVTNAPLDRAQCIVLAKMATAGLARTLMPAFAPFDGDTVFAISTGTGERVDPITLMTLGHWAAIATAQSIVGAVRR